MNVSALMAEAYNFNRFKWNIADTTRNYSSSYICYLVHFLLRLKVRPTCHCVKYIVLSVCLYDVTRGADSICVDKKKHEWENAAVQNIKKWIKQAKLATCSLWNHIKVAAYLKFPFLFWKHVYCRPPSTVSEKLLQFPLAANSSRYKS